MKTLKYTLCLVAALAIPAIAGEPHRRLPIHGQWDYWNPNLFVTNLELRRDRSYTITNNTDQAIYVMATEDRIVLGYFPLMPGSSQQFIAPWNLRANNYGLDLFLDAVTKLNGNAITLREGPEFIED